MGAKEQISLMQLSNGDRPIVHWVKEEVEEVDIGIEDLSFERGVRCTTNNEEVKTLCRVLGLAQQ